MSPLIPASDAIFRVLFSFIFIGAGVRHLIRPESIVARLLDAPLADLATAVAPAHLLVVLTGAVLLPAGLMLLVGFYTRVAALALIAVIVPITVTTHLGNPAAVGPLFKNIALLGGLIHFLSSGAGVFSIDRARARRAESLPDGMAVPR